MYDDSEYKEPEGRAAILLIATVLLIFLWLGLGVLFLLF